MEITKREDLAPYIQHTLIKVGTTREEIIRHAEEAVKSLEGSPDEQQAPTT